MIRFRITLTLTLVALCHGAAWAQPAQSHSSITIRTEGRERVLTAADLSKVSRHDLQIATKGSDEVVTVSGVRLWDLLQLAAVPSPQASGRQRAVMIVKRG